MKGVERSGECSSCDSDEKFIHEFAWNK